MDSLQLIVQILMAVIVIGGIYSLWEATRVYGGLIGGALKWIGVGTVFFFVDAIDRALGDLSVILSIAGDSAYVIHTLVLILGVLFSALGFLQLNRIGKE